MHGIEQNGKGTVLKIVLSKANPKHSTSRLALDSVCAVEGMEYKPGSLEI